MKTGDLNGKLLKLASGWETEAGAFDRRGASGVSGHPLEKAAYRGTAERMRNMATQLRKAIGDEAS